MRFTIFTLVASILTVFTAFAAEISAINVNNDANGQVRIVFAGNQLQEDGVKIFQIKGESPRIVVDFNDASSSLLRNGNYTNKNFPSIEGIRAANKGKGQIRFVIDLPSGAELSSKTVKKHQLSVHIRGIASKGAALISASTREALPASDIPIPRIKPKVKAKPVIVIDAGHGGHDPGALGTKGLREKKVTLQAAIELNRQLQATGRYKVVLTRGDDRYLEHENRLRIARANNADLFISIHADATEGKTARGASVYTLADRAKNRSKKIVNSQNWIMDVNLSQQTDKVGDILVDLAQRNTASKSTQFADILISKLGTSTKLLRNTHRRAGYYVLLAPDVPAVLLELGFISNPQDETLLKSTQHRQKLMRSVVSAINQYFPR